jgi:hypothetical protein
MKLFKRSTPPAGLPAPAPEPAAPEPQPLPLVAMATVAQAPLFNATEEEQFASLAYRADAIARGYEQRIEAGDELHPEHDQMVAEAMEHGWRLVRYRKWARVHVDGLAARLGIS